MTDSRDTPAAGPSSGDIRSAAAYLEPYVVRTPVLRSEALDARVGCRLVAKAECLQATGSFKVRGALNRARTLAADARERGLLTVSAGNAALGLAYAGNVLGAAVTVVMPEGAVREKVEGVRALGGTVVQEGVTDAAGAFERAARLQVAEGLTFVHPFDDPQVIAGAATATLELLEQEPQLDRLLVPCSGGGLLAGAIVAARAARHPLEVIGVQPETAATLIRSLEVGHPTTVKHQSTIADGLTAPKPGQLNFDLIRAAGISIVAVDEVAIRRAVRDLIMTMKIVAEPAAAVGLAAIQAGIVPPSGGLTGLLLSGSNIARPILAGCLSD